MTEEQEILALLDRHLRSIWAGDLETYTATTAPDVTFYEWYISTQRIDGLDFHLRETAANFRAAWKGAGRQDSVTKSSTRCFSRRCSSTAKWRSSPTRC